MMRLAIICTHPIQYYAPIFKLLAQKIELKVFYTAGKNLCYDKGFRQCIRWDTPVLEGYNYEFLKNNVINSITDFSADQLLIYGWAHYKHIKILYHFKGRIPLLFRGDSTLLNFRPGLKSMLKKLVLNCVYRHVDKALYVGTNNKAYFKKHGIKEQQLIFVPHAVDNQRFAEKADISIRRALQLRDQDILILYAGKFEPVKNPQLLLRAFLDLKLLNVHLLFAGDGILGALLKQTCSGRRNVHFLPFQNQLSMPAIYQACDLFCLPSRNDSWGLSVNEAMAAGKAVLVSDKTGSAADLVKITNGRIFKSGDVDDLKEKIKELTSDPEGLKLKGIASLAIISQWNFEKQVKNILDAIG